ncbi:MAG: HAD family hydrolase [bacterium]
MIWRRTSQRIKADTIVLDIDGVLVDVHASFKAAVCQGAEFYLADFCGLKGIKIRPEETVWFKSAGGFNNDWDLALAIVLYYRCQPDFSLADYTKRLHKLGGGLSAAERVLHCQIDRTEKEQVAWICQEFYAGGKYCERLYGRPLSYLAKGTSALLELEQILLDLPLLLKTDLKLGILTGRNWQEAELVLERIGLLPYLKRENILTSDDGYCKPDCECLNVLAERLKTAQGIFVGDTLDDLRTTKGTGIPWISGIVLSGGGEKDFFVHEGADVIVADINELLDFLLEEKGYA